MGWIGHILLIHSLVNDIWFAFWWKISAILITSLNNTALNTVQFLFQRTFFFNSQVASGLPWWLRWQVIPRSRYAGGMVMPTFWRATNFLKSGCFPFYISTYIVWGFQLFKITAVLLGVKWHLSVVLSCIYLMTDDTKFFTSLLQSGFCWLKKDVHLESCELSFIWGKMRTAAWEAASQIALKDCSKAAVGESRYISFGEGGVQYHEALILQKVFLLVLRIWYHHEGI